VGPAPSNRLSARYVGAFGKALFTRAKEVTFRDWWFLRPALWPELSRGYPSAESPTLSYGSLQALKFLYSVRFAKGDPGAWERAYQTLLHRIEAELGGAPDGKVLPVERVKPDELTPDEVYERFVRRPRPIVLEGFARDTPAVQNWSHEYFGKLYGDEKVAINVGPLVYASDDPSRPAPGKSYVGTIGEIAENIDHEDLPRGERLYTHNMTDIFMRHRELLADLELHRLRPYAGPNMHFLGCHLFFGGKGSGSSFHCAQAFNTFSMIEGKKRWRFVHPEHTPFMYPFVKIIGAASTVGDVSDEERQRRYPLFRYATVYETEIGPGDVLFNPPWWWHEVQNLTQSTIGVATRWYGELNDRSANILFDAYLRTQLWPLMQYADYLAGLTPSPLPSDEAAIPRRIY
jgi:hypothetical protein